MPLANDELKSKVLLAIKKLPESFNSAKSNWQFKLSIILSVVLLIMILLNIVNSVYFFIPPQTKDNATQTSVNMHSNSVLYQQISHWHLFGVSATSGIAVTQLSIKLTGILIDMQSKQATAIIDTPDGKEKIYHIGDALADGAIIYSISPHEVIIQYMGRMERLPLKPSLDNNGQQNSPENNTVISNPIESNPTINPELGDYLNMLQRLRNNFSR